MKNKNEFLSIAQIYSSWATNLKVEDIPKSVIDKLNIIAVSYTHLRAHET